MKDAKQVSELQTVDGKRELTKMLDMGVTEKDMSFIVGDAGEEIVLINKNALIALIRDSPLGREVAFRRIRDRLGALYQFTLEDEAAIFC